MPEAFPCLEAMRVTEGKGQAQLCPLGMGGQGNWLSLQRWPWSLLRDKPQGLSVAVFVTHHGNNPVTVPLLPCLAFPHPPVSPPVTLHVNERPSNPVVLSLPNASTSCGCYFITVISLLL